MNKSKAIKTEKMNMSEKECDCEMWWNAGKMDKMCE